MSEAAWSFTVVFDEMRARERSYIVGGLYDCVDAIARENGCRREDKFTWSAAQADNPKKRLHAALSRLCRAGCVMENVKSLRFTEGDGDGYDLIAMLDEWKRKRSKGTGKAIVKEQKAGTATRGARQYPDNVMRQKQGLGAVDGGGYEGKHIRRH